MAALIAVDARKTLVQVTAVENAIEDPDLYRSVDRSGGIGHLELQSSFFEVASCIVEEQCGY
jgi:hypothetical protein